MFNYPKQTARVLTFSHFNRKGWSLFSSLHREVRIGVLSAATLTTATPCLAGATAAHAEGDPTANLTEMTADTLTLGEAAGVTACANGGRHGGTTGGDADARRFERGRCDLH